MPISRAWIVPLFLLAAVICSGRAEAAEAGEVRVEADFPGGNIVVQRLASDTVWVAPDLRDTQAKQWWFYWNFRLRAPAGRPVNVVFTDRNPLGVRGPALSIDGGKTWRWLGAAAVAAQKVDGRPTWSFVAEVPAGATDVRYAFCPQYLEDHLQAWRKKHEGHPALRLGELARSRQGRAVELIRAGCLDAAKSRGVVLLTARHHCCETMASYALEGWLEAVLAEDDLGRRWRSNWEVRAAPFMDKDGVEAGDQGKNRTPHDHNRDYNAEPRYPEVAAMMQLGGEIGRRVVAAVDLHCPHIRGEWNDRVYLVGSPEAAVWQGQTGFAAVLERVQEGTIRFRAADCLAYGTAWNTANNTRQGRSFGGWATTAFPEARLVTTIEIAYADALGAEVNATSARALGRDLARALAEFLAAER